MEKFPKKTLFLGTAVLLGRVAYKYVKESCQSLDLVPGVGTNGTISTTSESSLQDDNHRKLEGTYVQPPIVELQRTLQTPTAIVTAAETAEWDKILADTKASHLEPMEETGQQG